MKQKRPVTRTLLSPSRVKGMKRRFRGADGNIYVQRKGHIFEYVQKKYVGGELIDYVQWRGVVQIDGNMYWKASKDRKVVEKWLENLLKIHKAKKITEYAKREPPKLIKAKYGKPVRIGADGERSVSPDV